MTKTVDKVRTNGRNSADDTYDVEFKERSLFTEGEGKPKSQKAAWVDRGTAGEKYED